MAAATYYGILKDFFKSRFMKILYFLLILFVIAGAGFYVFQSSSVDRAPGLVAYSIIDDREVELPLSEARPAVLLFWSTTCSACKVEMHRLQQAVLAGKIPPGQIWAVAVGDSIEAIKEYAQQSEYSFQYFVVPQIENIKSYQVSGTPTTYHFDSAGNIQWRGEGVHPESIARAESLFKPLP